MSQIQIPKGWSETTINNIGEVVTGSTPATSKLEFFGNEYPFYKPADLDAGNFISSSKDGLSKLGLEQSRFLPKNSILVVCIGASIGKASVINKEGASNQQINAIIPDSKKILTKFLYYYIKSQIFQRQIFHNANTSAIPILNKSKFQTLKLVLPDLSVQKKIIQKLDYILEQLEEKKQVILKLYNLNHLKQPFDYNYIPA